jgi:hypothetical protein
MCWVVCVAEKEDEFMVNDAHHLKMLIVRAIGAMGYV